MKNVRRLVVSFLAFAILLTLWPSRATIAQTNASVRVDYQLISEDGILVNDVLLAPLRPIAEASGAYLQYGSGSGTATVSLGPRVLEITRDSRTLIVNGQTVRMPLSARLVGDRLYVPVGYVFRALGFKTTWYSRDRRMDIDTTQGALTILLCATCVTLPGKNFKGHIAMAMKDADTWTYFSYGPAGGSTPLGKGFLEHTQLRPISTTSPKGIAKAVATQVNKSYRTFEQQYDWAIYLPDVKLKEIEQAKGKMFWYANSIYSVLNSNCLTAVHDALELTRYDFDLPSDVGHAPTGWVRALRDEKFSPLENWWTSNPEQWLPGD